jgi:hypothetical protein
MIPGLNAATGMAVALAITGVGTAGTAYAATPAPEVTHAVPQNPPHKPPVPPHRFRARFHSLAQCQAAARHDHPREAAAWDCRRGPDRKSPWEYWGR